ncbi:hypothetical protein INS43_05225 [Corynebacterium aurimucosum]|uniref:hypothetical protein n=1 Tax=Corynebacterium aurimucosum TaxID=169292 RepID=UPI00187AA3ED|nr:hypothetical protein [Corynebacterium aurimucosum]MBE7364588.1 hypothetical protein [Corynebacterium aurimucosum]
MYPFPEMQEFFPPLTPGSVFIVASSDPHLAHAVIRQVELSWRSRPGASQLDLPLVPLRRTDQSWESYLATARRTAQSLDTVAFLPVSAEVPAVVGHPVVSIKHGDTGLLDLTMLWNDRQRTAPYRLSAETGALLPAHAADLPTHDIMQELFLIEPATVVKEAERSLRSLLENQPEVFRTKLRLGEGEISLNRLECQDIESTEHHISATFALYVDINENSTTHTIAATGIPDGYGGFASFNVEY